MSGEVLIQNIDSQVYVHNEYHVQFDFIGLDRPLTFNDVIHALEAAILTTKQKAKDELPTCDDINCDIHHDQETKKDGETVH